MNKKVKEPERRRLFLNIVRAPGADDSVSAARPLAVHAQPVHSSDTETGDNETEPVTNGLALAMAPQTRRSVLARLGQWGRGALAQCFMPLPSPTDLLPLLDKASAAGETPAGEDSIPALSTLPQKVGMSDLAWLKNLPDPDRPLSELDAREHDAISILSQMHERMGDAYLILMSYDISKASLRSSSTCDPESQHEAIWAFQESHAHLLAFSCIPQWPELLERIGRHKSQLQSLDNHNYDKGGTYFMAFSEVTTAAKMRAAIVRESRDLSDIIAHNQLLPRDPNQKNMDDAEDLIASRNAGWIYMRGEEGSLQPLPNDTQTNSEALQEQLEIQVMTVHGFEPMVFKLGPDARKRINRFAQHPLNRALLSDPERAEHFRQFFGCSMDTFWQPKTGTETDLKIRQNVGLIPEGFTFPENWDLDTLYHALQSPIWRELDLHVPEWPIMDLAAAYDNVYLEPVPGSICRQVIMESPCDDRLREDHIIRGARLDPIRDAHIIQVINNYGRTEKIRTDHEREQMLRCLNRQDHIHARQSSKTAKAAIERWMAENPDKVLEFGRFHAGAKAPKPQGMG